MTDNDRKPFDVFLFWPAKDLNPNSRVHRAKKAKLKADARDMAFYAAKLMDADGHADKYWQGAAEYKAVLLFYPPDRRYRDLDNMLASMKAGLDGVCAALGIDDKLITNIEIQKLDHQDGDGGHVYINIRPL